MRTRRHPVVRLALLLLLPVLLALAAPGSAEAIWSAPVTLSGAGQDASSPQVAVDPNGNAVFVWQRYDGTTGCGGSACLRVQARARSAAGVLSATQTLSSSGQNADLAQVGVDQSDNAVFVWRRKDGTTGCGGSGCFRIEARARSAAGVLSAPQLLSPQGRDANSPQVAVDQNGNAVFVWQRFGGGTGCGGSACLLIEARARSAAGTLSSAQILSGPGQNANSAQVAVDPNGNAVFVWQRYDGTTDCGGFPCTQIQGRARSAAGALSATQALSATRQDPLKYGRPQVAVDPSGNAVFVWARLDAQSSTSCVFRQSGCFRVHARARSAAGALSTTQTLTAPGLDAFDTQVGIDQGGNAVFVWLRNDGDGGINCGPVGFGCSVVHARARSAAGTLSATQTLSAGSPHSFGPQVAVDQAGNAVFVWQRGGVIEARTRSAAGALSATQTLSAAGQNADLPQVGVDQSGGAVAVWQRLDGANDRIQAAAGP